MSTLAEWPAEMAKAEMVFVKKRKRNDGSITIFVEELKVFSGKVVQIVYGFLFMVKAKLGG